MPYNHSGLDMRDLPLQSGCGRHSGRWRTDWQPRPPMPAPTQRFFFLPFLGPRDLGGADLPAAAGLLLPPDLPPGLADALAPPDLPFLPSASFLPSRAASSRALLRGAAGFSPPPSLLQR